MSSLPSVSAKRQTIRQQALWRLAGVMLVMILGISVIGFNSFITRQQREIKQKIEVTRSFYEQALPRVEMRWRQEAEQVRSHIEFTRMLEGKTELRWAALNTFLLSQAEFLEFSNLLILSPQGKPIYRYGSELVVLSASAEAIQAGWHFVSATSELFRILQTPIKLGSGGQGTLVLFKPFNASTLQGLVTPETHLHVFGFGKLIVNTDPTAVAISTSGHEGLHTDRTPAPIQFEMGWPHNGLLAPTLVIHREFVDSISLAEFMLRPLAAMVMVALMLWLGLGRWLSLVVRRIESLESAAHIYAKTGTSAEVSSLLAPAHAVHDEIDDVAVTLENMMVLVHERETEQRTYLETLAMLEEAVLELDCDGRVLNASPGWYRLTHCPDNIRGVSITEFIHFDDVAVMCSLCDRFKNPEEPQAQLRMKLRLRTDTGAEQWVECRFIAHIGTNGQLTGIRGILRDVTQTYQHELQISHLALHDALTDLPNRTLLTERFELSIAAARRQERMMGVLLIDLDGFKTVNDRYGHATGDLLLKEVAHRLNLMVRGEDTLARLGGDEFAVIVNNVTGTHELESAVKRILTSMSQKYIIEGQEMHISSSIGVTLFPTDDADADTLLRHADQAMYQAKQAGRNRYCLFDVVSDQSTESNLRVVARTRAALNAGELCLHYQPKINMRTGSVEGFEALLRWQHPENGLIPPLSFLPQVEHSDLIIDIGEWVMDQALYQIESWREQGAVWPVSVNIAARHFQRKDFVQCLSDRLARHPDVSPALLNIEILESVAIDDISAVSDVIRKCQALGVSFSLDDFGTGYSSLSYLKALRADTLKIDQSFVRQMLNDKDDLTLVETVINIARLFKIDVIAEGVETVDHGTLLLRLGCDSAQGYGIARPMPAHETYRWAKRYKPAPQWKQWADIAWEWSDLPLLMAQHDHEYWIKQVLLAVEGVPLSLSDAEILDQHQCRFGHWYNGPGQERYGHLPEFKEINAVHTQVHQVGPAIIRLHGSGDLEQARQLRETLLDLKQEILVRLNALQASVIRTIVNAR